MNCSDLIGVAWNAPPGLDNALGARNRRYWIHYRLVRAILNRFDEFITGSAVDYHPVAGMRSLKNVIHGVLVRDAGLNRNSISSQIRVMILQTD